MNEKPKFPIGSTLSTVLGVGGTSISLLTLLGIIEKTGTAEENCSIGFLIPVGIFIAYCGITGIRDAYRSYQQWRYQQCHPTTSTKH